MPLTQAQKTKLNKLKASGTWSGTWRADCCVCGKPLDPEDEQTEYCKTKRGTENFSTVTALGGGANESSH